MRRALPAARTPGPTRVLGPARVLAILGVLAVLLSGCGTDAKPTVTWRSGESTQTVGPSQYCDIRMTDCSDDEEARAGLAVPRGGTVEVAVPDEVAEAPWSVVFAYTDVSGLQVNGRSPVFAPNAQDSYTLTLPDPGDTLLTAQVQMLGAAPVVNPESGELEYPARATWVLVAQG